jgi:uncharacterized membrane protein
MDFSADLLIRLLSRWLHVLAAITAVGGTVFIWYALLPSLASLPEHQRKQLHDALRARWSKVVMICIALLLITGLYNFIVIARGLSADERTVGIKTFYHSFFGIKFLLALGIFFIASALIGRSPAFEKIRSKAPFWAGLNVALAILVVCISGFLRLSRDDALRPDPALRVAPVSQPGENESR